MRDATLSRRALWHCAERGTSRGAVLEVAFDRFVSAARPHLAVQRMTVRADRDVTLTVRGGIDADVRTSGHDHLSEVEIGRSGDDGIDCRVRTDAGCGVRLLTRLCAPGAMWSCEEADRAARLVAEVHVAAGELVTVEKRTAVTTDRDRDGADAAEILDEASGLAFEALHEEHAAIWRERWDRSDVIVEGDEESQRALRCSIYHLLRAHVTGDERVAIDAKGYAGDAYFGRFFWDTEMYMFPFYLYTDPARARTLVDFRVQSLPGARANAASYGYPGARYAWESDEYGRDQCAAWQYRDHQVHVTADVVYAFAHYAAATGDPGYLAGPAAEVIAETARYWLARMDRRAGEDYPSLLGVMGPDEYVPICHNSAYTNRMVKFALALAAGESGGEGRASQAERAAFAEAAEKLPIPRSQDGRLVMQCEGFDRLAEPRFDEFWPDRDGLYGPHVKQERLYRSKNIKQADVIMLMNLFPRECSDNEVRAAWDYYLPVTTHDSSLSAGMHAIVACRLGFREMAWEFWKRSSGLDLDVRHGGAAEGIHIAAAAANWQVAVFGFAGMAGAMESETFTLRPRLPEAWTRLAFPNEWKGHRVFVDIRGGSASVTNRGETPIEASVAGVSLTVPPGGTVAFEPPPGPAKREAP